MTRLRSEFRSDKYHGLQSGNRYEEGAKQFADSRLPARRWKTTAFWGSDSIRAITRFKRHAAKSVYRIHVTTGNPADAQAAELFTGAVDDTNTDATLVEIQERLSKKWKVRFGRFQTKIGGLATL